MTARRKLILITLTYWFMLLYIIAALVLWFQNLMQQSNEMTALRLARITQDDPAYGKLVDEALNIQKRKHAQYIGEGSVFLLLIMIGAVFVYRAVRRQLRLSQQQQNFMMAITHELKTPIAITKLNLETLQKRKLEESQQQKLIGNTLQEANRLNDLCNNILLTSQLEGGAYRFEREEIDLGDLVKASVEQYRHRFASRVIESSIENDAGVMGEPLLLQMLVNNLLENALKYSPKDKPLYVEVKQEGRYIKLLVKDEGSGIAAGEKEKIFEKFYRIGNENTRTSKGTGLGLYLSKKIVQDHNADITVTDNEPRGSIFTVTFQRK